MEAVSAIDFSFEMTTSGTVRCIWSSAPFEPAPRGVPSTTAKCFEVQRQEFCSTSYQPAISCDFTLGSATCTVEGARAGSSSVWPVTRLRLLQPGKRQRTMMSSKAAVRRDVTSIANLFNLHQATIEGGAATLVG